MGPRGVRASCKEEERERERKTLDAGEKWERIGPEKMESNQWDWMEMALYLPNMYYSTLFLFPQPGMEVVK